MKQNDIIFLFYFNLLGVHDCSAAIQCLQWTPSLSLTQLRGQNWLRAAGFYVEAKVRLLVFKLISFSVFQGL